MVSTVGTTNTAEDEGKMGTAVCVQPRLINVLAWRETRGFRRHSGPPF